jgi:anti-sigma regulatory factor (Ser/Thr protein kinase)
VGDPIERIRTCVALEEALLNAIYHGNLEIDEGELAKAHGDFEEERLALLAAELAKARVAAESQDSPQIAEHRQDLEVTLDAHISAECARFVIRDSGSGFDHASMAQRRLSDYFERGESRGIMLMRLMMDEVNFNAVGNEVTLVKVNH